MVQCVYSYSSLGARVRHVLTRDHTVLPATHTLIHKWDESYLPLTPAAERCRTWLVLISRHGPAEGRRLSSSGWLGEILRLFARPKTVTNPKFDLCLCMSGH